MFDLPPAADCGGSLLHETHCFGSAESENTIFRRARFAEYAPHPARRTCKAAFGAISSPCTERAGLEGAQSPSMTYVVIDSCIACKYTDCVEVCPVDCFYEGENMLVIHPDECIDCGVCEPECPVDAIRPDTEPGMEKWVEFNRKFSEVWPVIIEKIDAPPDAESHEGEEGKLE